MTEQEERERMRYLQLKKKQASSGQAEGKGLLGKAWDALGVPEEMSREGLTKMAEMVPEGTMTGNVPLDMITGTPKIAAETLAEVAPGFVSRGSMLMGGAAKGLKYVKPLAKSFGKGVAGQLESLSGAEKGSLAAAFKDPSLMFRQGKEAAGKLYQEAKGAGKALLKKRSVEKAIKPIQEKGVRALKAKFPKTIKGTLEKGNLESAIKSEVSVAKQAAIKEADELKKLTKSKKIADSSVDKLNEGTLTPYEAFRARKAVDSMYGSKKYIADDLSDLRKGFDKSAKSSKNISDADRMYQRGMYSESLRTILPQNKYGGASPFKMMMGALAAPIAPLLSPAAQGMGASALGTVAKVAKPFLSTTRRAIGTGGVVDQVSDYLSKKYEKKGTR